MTAPRITSRLEYKMNIGNYESFNIVVGVEADAMEGETVAEAQTRISDFVEATLQNKVREAYNEFVGKRTGAVQG